MSDQTFLFEQLNDDAKEKARQWYRDRMNNDFYFETELITECLEEKLEDYGFKDNVKIYWSVGFVQGDYASFECKSVDVPEMIRKMHDRGFLDVDDYNALKPFWDNISMWVDSGSRGEHANGQIEDCTYYQDKEISQDVFDMLEKAWDQYVKDVAGDLYRLAREQVEYYYSDECIDENIICNEYEFDEDGSRA